MRITTLLVALAVSVPAQAFNLKPCEFSGPSAIVAPDMDADYLCKEEPTISILVENGRVHDSHFIDAFQNGPVRSELQNALAMAVAKARGFKPPVIAAATQ